MCENSLTLFSPHVCSVFFCRLFDTTLQMWCLFRSLFSAFECVPRHFESSFGLRRKWKVWWKGWLLNSLRNYYHGIKRLFSGYWKKHKFFDTCALKMGPICCPDTSENNYHMIPCNIPEERMSISPFRLMFILLILIVHKSWISWGTGRVFHYSSFNWPTSNTH